MQSIDACIQQLQPGNQGNLIVISGPSGVGKGTLVNQVLPRLENLALSVSATTRAPRAGEEHGRNYFFLSHEAFQALIQEQALLEYATYHHNFYGTPKAFVLEQLQTGHDVILEIDVQGAEQIRQNWSERMVQIFILPPSEAALRSRLVGRQSETPESIAHRLEKVTKECEQLPYYDYYVINDDLQVAVNDVSAIIRAERHKIK